MTDSTSPGPWRRRPVSRIVWGIFLVVLGVALLLDRFGTLNVPPLGDWWPLILVVIGVIKLAELRLGGGLFMIALGAWFYACETGWNDMTYGDSWPFVIIAFGVKIVIDALTCRWLRGQGQGGSCCV